MSSGFFLGKRIVKLEEMKRLPEINDDLAGKKVFVRGDIDVPIEGGVIKDDTRLIDIWPTIEWLLSKNCEVVLAGHLGRPGGKATPELSTRPVAEWLSKKIQAGDSVIEEKVGEFNGFNITKNLAVLENLRFDPREEENNEDFGKALADLAEIYVNEAFAVSERKHASIVGTPKYLSHFAGLRFQKEVEVLSSVLENPARPLVVVIGGAKLETKIPLISKMAQIADAVIVGGKLLAEIAVGNPILGMDKVKLLRLTPDGKDVTLESIAKIEGLLSDSKTTVWNGPMGLVENFTYQVGTRRLAEFIGGTMAKKIVGGGDTVGFLKKLGVESQYSWVSSGGGSMLNFLATGSLPGIEALLN